MEVQDTCKNCGAELTGPFCSHCGQPVITKRITVRNLIAYVFSAITNVERGLWFTLYALLKRPATVIQEYINGRTRPYYHPLRLAFLLSTISVIVMLGLFDYEAAQANFAEQLNRNISEEQKAFQLKVNRTIQPFLNFLPLFLIPFYSIGTYLFNRKKQFNYAEHLVLNAFLYGLITFISYPLFLVYFYLDDMMISAYVGFVLYSIIGGFVLKKLFGGNLVLNIMKALSSYIIGFFIFLILSVFIGAIIGIASSLLRG